MQSRDGEAPAVECMVEHGKRVPIPRRRSKPLPYRFDALLDFGDSFLLKCAPDRAERRRVLRACWSAAAYHGRRRRVLFLVSMIPEGVRVHHAGTY